MRSKQTLQKERGHSEHIISSAGVSEQIPLKSIWTTGREKVQLKINDLRNAMKYIQEDP